MMIGGNLFSPKSGGWSGEGVYPSEFINDEDGIKGSYSRKQGIIEKNLVKLYEERMNTPKSDPRNLAIKILINTMYGICGSPIFKSIYNITTASDVTAMARRSIKFARTFLHSRGYEICYGDTDSVFVIDRTNNLERLQECINYINETQKKCFNIPFQHHGLVLEKIIKRIYFFRNDKGEFIKKHYIYVSDDDKITIKGVNIKRGNCSRFTRMFYDDVIEPLILKNKYTPYKQDDLLLQLKKFVIGREELLQKRYRVKAPEEYKIPKGKEESNSLMYLIAKKYGAGEHWLVANKRLGVGKGRRYTTMDYLKSKYGDRWVDQLHFDVYLSELKEFIQWDDRKKIK